MPHSPALLSTCKQQVEVTEKGFWLSRESRCVWCLREENKEQGIDGCEPAEGDPAVVSTSYDERVMGICKSEQLEEVRGARQEKEVGAAKLATAPAAQLYSLFSFLSLTRMHTHTRFLLFFCYNGQS